MRIEHRAGLGSRLLRHADRVACVRWSTDGTTLVSGAWDGTVALWDVESGARQATWKGHVGPVHAVDFDRRSGAVLSCGEDGTIRRWSTPDSAPPFALLVSAGPLQAMHIQGNRAHLGGADGRIQTVALDTALVLPSSRLHDAATRPLAVSIDHRFMMQSRGSDGLVIWETDAPATTVAVVGRNADLVGDPSSVSIVTFAEHRMTFRAWPRQVTGLALSADGTRLYSCGQDGGVRSWELSGDRPSTWFARDAGVVRAVCVDAMRDVVWTAGEDGRVRAYRDEVSVGAAKVSEQPLLAVTVSATAVFSAGQDTHIHELGGVVDDDDDEQADPQGDADATFAERGEGLRGHFWHVTTLDTHPSEAFLASASKDYTIRIWSTEARREVSPHIDAPDDYIDAVAWTDGVDGPSILAGSEDGSVRRWWMDGRMALLARMGGQVHAIALPPAGEVAIAADDEGAVIGIDLRSGRNWELAGPAGRGSGFLTIVSQDADGFSTAIGVRRSGQVCRLTTCAARTSSIEVLGQVPVGPIVSAAISADLTRVAVGDRLGTVAAYRIASGVLVDTGVDRLHRGDWVTSLAWSPDGTALVSGGWDRVAWLRRCGSPPMPLRGHHETIRVCSFDGSGATCITGSWDGMLYGWDADVGALRAWAEVEGRAVSIALLPGDHCTLVATGNADTTVSVFELRQESSP